MSFRLFLFGQFRWELPDGTIVPQMRMKTQALVAYVALSANGIVRRDQIATLLWENSKEPLGNLRHAIKEIRDIQEEIGYQLISTEGSNISLDFNDLWVDARVASQCAKQFSTDLAIQLVEAKPQQLLEDCDIHDGLFDDWLLSERSRREEELRQCLGVYLEKASEKRHNLSEIHKITSAIFGFDPTNETAHQELMRAYAEAGDRGSALRQFEICEETLSRELGVEPSLETRQLLQTVKAEERPQLIVNQVIEPSREFVTLDTRPTLVVEDFSVPSSDSVTEFIARSFRSDICEQLSRNDHFAIKDDNFAGFGGEQVSPAAYIYRVRGTVLGTGDALSILLQLLDDRSGEILWMKRISPKLADVLSGLDEQAVFMAIEIYRLVELKETDKAKSTEESLLTAQQCLLRAVAIMFKFSEDAVRRAEGYIMRALSIDPNFAEAYAWLAFLRSIDIGQGYTSDVDATREEIGELVRQSQEIRPDSDIGLAIAGHLEAFVHHDFGTALEYFDKSQSANPNCAHAWGFSAITHCYIGEADKALSMLARCRQIMPFDPHPYYFDTARCIASMLSGRYEDAVRIGQQVLRNNPNFHANYRPLISSLGHLGRMDEATPLLQEFSKIQPDFSVDWHLATYPPLDQELTDRYVEGLKLAGVSES